MDRSDIGEMNALSPAPATLLALLASWNRSGAYSLEYAVEVEK